MQLTHATHAAPGGTNEDYIVSGPNWVAVLDGATPRADTNSGCVHDVPWLVKNIGTNFSNAINARPDITLSNALRIAIQKTCMEHENTCDITNPDSPSSTFAAIRKHGKPPAIFLDYLVLGDSPILIQNTTGDVTTISDNRSGQLSDYTTEGIRAARNQPGGFWIASTRPEVADHAIAGTLRLVDIQRTAVLTDGVTRYFERLEIGTEIQLLNDLYELGPDSVIKRIRTEEVKQLPLEGKEPNGRRVKRHDDATAVTIDWEGEHGEIREAALAAT